MPFEQALPDHRDDRRGADNLRKAREVRGDFAPRDAELDQRAHAGEPARDHLAVVEIGDRGKRGPSARSGG